MVRVVIMLAIQMTSIAASRIAAAAQIDQSYSPGGANVHLVSAPKRHLNWFNRFALFTGVSRGPSPTQTVAPETGDICVAIGRIDPCDACSATET